MVYCFASVKALTTLNLDTGTTLQLFITYNTNHYLYIAMLLVLVNKTLVHKVDSESYF